VELRTPHDTPPHLITPSPTFAHSSTARAIDDSDKAAGLQAAHYRLSARMRELEAQYDAKASELRAAFVSECQEILGGDGDE
jgi:hypothetical protein